MTVDKNIFLCLFILLFSGILLSLALIFLPTPNRTPILTRAKDADQQGEIPSYYPSPLSFPSSLCLHFSISLTYSIYRSLSLSLSLFLCLSLSLSLSLCLSVSLCLSLSLSLSLSLLTIGLLLLSYIHHPLIKIFL